MECRECDGLLVAYVKGELSKEDARLVERHVAACRSCRWNAEWARQSLSRVADAADEERPAAKIVSFILQRAIQEGASDIHIERRAAPEPSPEGAEPGSPPMLAAELAHLVDALGEPDDPAGASTVVRYRIDGVLRNAIQLPGLLHEPLAVRLMVVADLNPFERRVPQFGRVFMTHEGREYDFRVTTLPATRGLRFTIRILDRAAKTVGLDGLGLSDTNRERLQVACTQPTGLFLVAGPAGGGRTTLMYALLMHLNSEAISVMTVEDPVESEIPGLTQFHLNRRVGLDYPAALKAILRSDPDVIMCGEVPDGPTAAALVELAITGHLVITSVAGVDAAGGITRFLDLVPDRLLAAKVLIGAAGVRLVRKVCEHCAQEVEPAAIDVEYLRRAGVKEPPAKLRQGVGCDHCRKTGYRGRTGIQEVMAVRVAPGPERLPEASVEEIRGVIRPSMAEDAAGKVVAGVTTIDEVQRVLACTGRG